MLFRLVIILSLVLCGSSAYAQSTPSWSFGFVPTPTEWNNLWASKEDFAPSTSGTPSQGYVGEPSFGGFTWKTANIFTHTESATHATEFHSTMAIVNNSTGSGANGPAYNDSVLTLSCNRTNYLTTAILGEISCQWNYLTQGAKGDASGQLVSLRRVDSATEPNWGSTAVETELDHISPTSGTVIRAAHLSVGYGITGHQEITAVVSGAGGVCRVTVADTTPLDTTGGVGVTITGVRGSTECNGQWGFTKVNSTQIDLTGSVFHTTYTGGGSAGTTTGSIGGPNFGFEARATTGQQGTAFLASHSAQPANGTWGSAFKVRMENDWTVAFDMSGNTGRFVVQPPIYQSMLDENYSATFLSGPIRWAGNTAAMPSDPDHDPGLTAFPGGGALGWNHTGGSGEVDMWNLYTGASATLNIYQKLTASTERLMFTVASSGSTLNTPLTMPTDGMVIGAATGGYKGIGTINLSDKYYVNNTAGITCGPGAPTASFNVVGGIVTAC